MDCVYVTFLVTGDELQFVVSSFPVYKPILKEIKLQWEETNRTIHVFDGFARPSNLLDHEQITRVCKPVEHVYNMKSISTWCINWSDHPRLLPAVAKIFFSHDITFVIEVCI